MGKPDKGLDRQDGRGRRTIARAGSTNPILRTGPILGTGAEFNDEYSLPGRLVKDGLDDAVPRVIDVDLMSSCRGVTGRHLGGVLMVVLLLVGCSDVRRRQSALDACALLTPATIEAVIGVPFDRPRRGQILRGGDGRATMSSCSWVSRTALTVPGQTEPDAGDTVRVTLAVWTWPSGSGGAVRYVRAMERSGGGVVGGSTRIRSLGERAYWDGSVHVAKGDVSMTLGVRPLVGLFSDEKDLAQERQLARQVLNRL